MTDPADSQWSGLHPSIQPLVSIGVPVYNGASTLASALDMLRAQTYSNLEIIISDNGSTDATPGISRAYADRDPRIQYHRSDTNRGALWNFNRVFELATGTYFVWAAHDDRRHPEFVAKCVEKLEMHPAAINCHVGTEQFIETSSERMCIVYGRSLAGLTDVATRYRESLSSLPVTMIYGMYRVALMRKTHLLTRSIASDVAFQQEAMIYGELVEVPETLFTYTGRQSWNTIQDDYQVWFGRRAKRWWNLPFVAVFMNHARRLRSAAIPQPLKLRLFALLVVNELRQVALKVAVKISGRLCPASMKKRLGTAVYWRWLHNRNVDVCAQDLFYERVIKPRLGWWR